MEESLTVIGQYSIILNGMEYQYTVRHKKCLKSGYTLQVDFRYTEIISKSYQVVRKHKMNRDSHFKMSIQKP